jgi:hypothetical protein
MKNSKLRYQVSLNPELVGKVIDHLRSSGNGNLADELQFGEGDERDELDGRCRLCTALQGGDRTHRCWAEP